MKKIKKIIRKIWYRMLGQPEPPRPFSSQRKFKKLYPAYKIGFASYGVPTVLDWKEGTTLEIGSYCSISKNVQIFLGGVHRTNWVSSFPFPKYFPEANHLIPDFGVSKGDVIIGSDVWLCRDSTIMSGVKIGHGAVVATGAIVTKDVPPYAVVAGSPAKIIRWRFDEHTRMELLASEWWNWPQDEIRKLVPLMCKDDLSEFLSYAKNRSQSTSQSEQ
jgi:chloramphenicol O-acetyltransferase type B